MEPLTLANPVVRGDMEEIYNSHIEWRQLHDSKIYIEGASGMIASYLVCFFVYLNEVHHYGIQIFAAVRSTEKAALRFGKYIDKEYFHLLRKDAIDPVSLKRTDIDYIIHAASLASPQYYNRMPVETALPNVVGTYELLRFGQKQVALKKFVFFSSGSVYGTVSSPKSIKEHDIGCVDFLDNGNCYGESKRCGEMLCHAYMSEYGVPATSIRIHHTYGPSMDIESDQRAFAEFVKNILKGENVVLKSNGMAKRAFCYLSDTLTAIITVMMQGVPGESYNIGNPNEYYTIQSVAETIVALRPKKMLKVIREERRDQGYRVSPEEDSKFVPVDITKIRGLGWEPHITIRDGFERVVSYFEKIYAADLRT